MLPHFQAEVEYAVCGPWNVILEALFMSAAVTRDLLQARSRNCEKLLLVSQCPSVNPHGTTRPPLDGFRLNKLFEFSSKICLENTRLIKIRQE